MYNVTVRIIVSSLGLFYTAIILPLELLESGVRGGGTEMDGILGSEEVPSLPCLSFFLLASLYRAFLVEAVDDYSRLLRGFQDYPITSRVYNYRQGASHPIRLELIMNLERSNWKGR